MIESLSWNGATGFQVYLLNELIHVLGLIFLNYDRVMRLDGALMENMLVTFRVIEISHILTCIMQAVS